MQKTLDKLRAGDHVTIVALGDSITHTSFHTHGRMNWVQLLEEALNATYGNNACTMINAGLCGGTANEARGRLERDVLRFMPDLVIIAFGMNDAGGGEAGLPEFLDHMRFLAATIRERCGSELLIRTPNPVVTVNGMPQPEGATIGRPWPQPNRPLALYAQALVALAGELGCPVVDHHTLWCEASFHASVPSLNPNHLWLRMSDAVHPGAIGHLAFFRELAPSFGVPVHFPWEGGES